MHHQIGDYGYIVAGNPTGWYYIVFNLNNKMALISDEAFEAEQEAKFAAVGHITLLEKEIKND